MEEYRFDNENIAITSVSDPKGYIVSFSQAFLDASGYEIEELIGKPHSILRHPDTPKVIFKDLWHTITHRKPWFGYIKNKRKDGTYYWVAANVVPIIEDDIIVGYRSIRHPATREQVKLAEEMYASINQNEESYTTNSVDVASSPTTLSDLESAKHSQIVAIHNERLMTIGTMAAGVAHEINNPVSGIIFNVKYAIKKTNDPKVLEALKQSEEELQRVAKIVQGLLSFSRQEQKDECTKFDLLDLIVDIELLMQSHLLTHKVKLNNYVAHALPKALANKDAVKQIIMNLIINASQAMSQQNDAHINIDAYIIRSENKILLRISDNGPGIPKDLQKRIFDPFFTTKTNGEGTGLGLSLASNMAKSFDGALLLDDNYEDGARFLLYIPTADDLSIHTNDIQYVDIQNLIQMQNLLSSGLAPIIEVYLMTLHENIYQISTSYKDNNLIELKKKTHFLKGSSLGVCATNISQICMNIEQSILKHELTVDTFQKYIVDLNQSAQKTFQILAEFIGKETELSNPF